MDSAHEALAKTRSPNPAKIPDHSITTTEAVTVLPSSDTDEKCDFETETNDTDGNIISDCDDVNE